MTAIAAPPAASLDLLDDPIELARFTRWVQDREGRRLAESALQVSGMHCAACADAIEHALQDVDGVASAEVSAAAERATVRWDPQRARGASLLHAVRGAGYDAVPDAAAPARGRVPAPVVDDVQGARIGIIGYGSSDAAIAEARHILSVRHETPTSYLRIRALPAHESIRDFIKKHDRVYLVEQNRDAQMASVLKVDFPEYAAKIQSVLHYNGLPIDALSIIVHKSNAQYRGRANTLRTAEWAQPPLPCHTGLTRLLLDPVRRLRARRDHGVDHQGLPRVRHRAARSRQA